ncbi:hypothetical protein [Sedimenticola thiotaurini]|uniref:Uncharacterized protein n=1 Tax=Sedimenticola thiotaurini TaxID=1543721 RepID=A0A0F7JRV6_9GAMM|nr:hypothetical protein [Sedimenticola thiotaurini]AKH19201.1 hypothetical protein AAY24_01305 [Sedimenticola thiotaurini]
MDNDTATILEAMEQAAMSGLCRDGQLEIGMQVARTIHPDMSEAELLAIAEAVYKRTLNSD